ncbi:MAG: ribbon-helix-helix domain-containing protein [Caldilinea sp.]|nr:ribbon-helix-helix protein, CopG family [Anaerolineales bacterium]HRA67272.1 ribbon-helix-helix domain-containing protein [Caldilinea sp.]
MTTKTIQLTFDETLLKQVDEIVQTLHVSRTDFVRKAVEEALHSHYIKRLEEKHIAGYVAQPQTIEEITEWDEVRVWGDE